MFKEKDKVTKILEDINSQIKAEDARIAYIEDYVIENGPYSNSERDLTYHRGRRDALAFLKMHINEFY